MSIPSGMLVEKYGAKKSMLMAFGLNFTGALLFALFPTYGIALASLFVIGIGMAMLQVIINPLMRVAGGEEHFAFFSVMGQLVFGAASFVSPFVFTYLMKNLPGYEGGGNLLIDSLAKLVPEGLPWSSFYWIFSVAFIVMILIILLVRLPKVRLKEDEKTGPLQSYTGLLGKSHVILYALGIMAYVGTEQGLANWMSKFLQTYHGIDPVTEGAATISWFWGLMAAGCLVGLLLLKLFDSKVILKGVTILTMLAVILALFGPVDVSRQAFSSTGFLIATMFSIIFSLALNSEEKHHGSFSGILCSGIFGGALIPLIIGWLGDMFGLRTGMMFLIITLSYILSIGFWAKPIISNKTISLKKENN
jgi:fucose permease